MYLRAYLLYGYPPIYPNSIPGYLAECFKGLVSGVFTYGYQGIYPSIPGYLLEYTRNLPKCDPNDLISYSGTLCRLYIYPTNYAIGSFCLLSSITRRSRMLFCFICSTKSRAEKESLSLLPSSAKRRESQYFCLLRSTKRTQRRGTCFLSSTVRRPSHKV